MKSYLLTLSLLALSQLAMAQKELPNDKKFRVTLKSIQLPAHTDEFNALFLGDNDFEMVVQFGNVDQLSFILPENDTDEAVKTDFNLDFVVDGKKKERPVFHRYSQYEMKNYPVGTKVCLFEDSWILIKSTENFGCFDLAVETNALMASGQSRRKVVVEGSLVRDHLDNPENQERFSKKVKSEFEIEIE